MSQVQGRPPQARETRTMRRMAIKEMLRLAGETADEELRFQCLAMVLSHSGDGRPPGGVSVSADVAPEGDAAAAG